MSPTEHDDRDRKSGGGNDLTIRKDSNRRVSFKTSGGPGRNNNMKSRVAEMGIRARIEEDDDMFEMTKGGDGEGRNNGRMRRRGSPIPRSARPGGQPQQKGKQLVEGASGWFQVLVSIFTTFSRKSMIFMIRRAIHKINKSEDYLDRYNFMLESSI